MISCQQIAQHVDDLLKTEHCADHAPNGCQVDTPRPIQRVISGVTASMAFIEAAMAHKPDLLLVHHGWYWKGQSPCAQGPLRARLKTLLTHDVGLLAYHLPLDRHEIFGNHRQLCRHLRWPEPGYHTAEGHTQLLALTELMSPLTPEAMVAHLASALDHTPLWLPGGGAQLKHIAVCTGAGHRCVERAQALGADALVTGEVAEATVHEALERGIHVFAAGHHATERYGVQALGAYLADRFGLEHHFLDCPSPV